MGHCAIKAYALTPVPDEDEDPGTVLCHPSTAPEEKEKAKLFGARDKLAAANNEKKAAKKSV